MSALLPRQPHVLTSVKAGATWIESVYDVGLIERGETNPTLLTLLRLASALDAELVELFKFSTRVPEASHVRAEIISLLSEKKTDDQCRALKILKLVFR